LVGALSLYLNFTVVELVKLRGLYPQNERAISRLIYNYLYLYPIYNATEGARVLEEACNVLSGDVKAIFRIAESNLNALNTVDFGPKRPFSAGECALWVRLIGPQLAAQVRAVVS
jgi:hypothetical protein